MTRPAVIVVFGVVLYLCFAPRGILAVPTEDDSVIGEIKRDNEICKAGYPFRDSSFAKICEKVKYPAGNVTLNPDIAELFLCLGFYDRITRLCHLDSMRGKKKSILPNNKDQFEAQINDTPLKTSEDIWNFCHNWNNKYPPVYNKTKPYVEQLHKVLNRDKVMCIKLCTDQNDNFKPICSVLAKMDEMSERINTGLAEVDEADKNKSQIQAIKPLSLQQDPRTQNAKVETDAKDVTSHQSAAETKVIEPPTKPQNKPPEARQIDANPEEPLHEEQHLTSAALQTTISKQLDEDPKQHPESSVIGGKASAVVVNNPDAKGTSNEGEKKQKTQEGKPTEKQTVEKAPQSNDDDSGNKAKTPKAPASVIDTAAPAPPQNEGTSGEDVADAVGGILDDPKLGDISQHTQDEPDEQVPGADAMDSLEQSSPDDDADSNSLQPSEKREYVPHMPRIPNEDDSHFFGYFTVIGVICIAGYVGYHNKQKILAMVLEGRRSRGGRSRRRPSTASYRKLDCTLEEAVTSQCNSNVTHVIY